VVRVQFSIVQIGNNVLVTWRDNRDGSYDIYAVKSSDGGENWSDLIKLVDSPDQSFWPIPALDNGVIHLAWVNMQDGECMLYHKYSEDAGESWSEESGLSSCVMPFDAGVLGLHPLAVGGSKVHLVFNDDRTGANEIYYLFGTIN